MKLSEIGDGLYTPRDYQIEALDFVDSSWSNNSRIILHAQTGAGKSNLARTIQRGKNSIVVVPNNVLVNQYSETYNVTKFIGQNHYKCSSLSDTCANIQRRGFNCRNKYSCSLTNSRTDAYSGNHIVTNYMMRWLSKDSTPHKSVVMDEGHQIVNVIRNITNASKKWTKWDKAFLKQHNISVDSLNSDFGYNEYLLKRIEQLNVDAEHDPGNETILTQKFEYEILHKTFTDAPQNFIKNFTKKDYTHYAIGLSSNVINLLLGDKAVMMSGTLLRHDIEEMFGTNYIEHRVQNVIPTKKRAVIIQPSQFPHSFGKIDYKQLAETIIETFNKTNLNGICHVTYSLAKELAPYINDSRFLMYCDKEEKTATIDEYIKRASISKTGNFLIGAGITEGLDLKGDLCRVNIIAKLLFPNMSDAFVQKKMALENGKIWYAGDTMKNLLQAIGRSTRGPDDRSVTVILDPAATKLINDSVRYKLIDKDFTGSLCLTSSEKTNAWNSL
jgi:hypothetical protein